MSLWDIYQQRWQIALNSGPTQAVTSSQWTDCTADVKVADGVSAVRGQQSGRGTAFEPTGSMNLVLRNGSFTAKHAAATPGRWSGKNLYVPIRWQIRYGATNYATPNQSSMETDVSDWESNTVLGTMTTATFASSTTHPYVGSKGCLITWPTTAIGSLVFSHFTGLEVGATYTASQYVYVPTGSPDVNLIVAFGTAGSYTSTKNALVRVTVTFVATSADMSIGTHCATATAGQQCWFDGMQVEKGSTATAYINDGPGWYDLWRGHIVQWQLDYTPGNETAGVTAAELPALLSRLVMPPLVTAEQLAAGAVGAWSLSDGVDSAFAGDSGGFSQGLYPIRVGTVAGTITYGTGTALGPEGGTVTTFARASSTSTTYLGTYAWTVGTWSGGVAVEAIVQPSAIGNDMVAVHLGGNNGAGGVAYLKLGVASTGVPYASLYIAGFIATAISATAITATTQTVLRGTYDGTTLTLYVNGVSAASAAAAIGNLNGEIIAVGSPPNYGGAPFNGSCWDGTISYVALYPSVTSPTSAAAVANAALNGHLSDTTDARFTRICQYAGLNADRYTSTGGLSTMSAQPTEASSVNMLLEQVGTAEQGIVLVDTSGRMVFQPRSARYNATPSLTLDASTGVLMSSSGQVKNDADLINVVSASRPNGAPVRATASAANLTRYGQATTDLTLLVDSDEQVRAIAQWRSTVDAVPADKFTSLTMSMVKLDALGLAATMLAVDISQVVRVTNLPAGTSPSSTLDLFVEGIRLDLDGNDLRPTLYMSSAAAGTVWILESPTYGQLDSTTILAL